MPLRTMLGFTILAAAVLLPTRTATCSEIAGAPDVPSAIIGNLLESVTTPAMTTARQAESFDALRRLYASLDNNPAWAGNGLAMAQQALRHLQAAEQYGLAASDYVINTPIPENPASNPGQFAQFDLELSAAMLDFLRDVHSGSTAPDFRWYAGILPRKDFDPAALLGKALKEGRLDEAITAAEPRSALYRRVKQALARYRQLAPRFRDIAPLPALPANTSLRLGMAYPGTANLVERLMLFGDMPEAASGNEGVYSPEIEEAVKRFQARHGLAEDGILGEATMSALAVPLPHRIRQLELTLERLRWMPTLPSGPLIVVNVPSFRLWALDTRVPSSAPQVEMRVIVGNAARTPTPLFIGLLRSIEFNPAWNVPRSIALEEIVPKLARDPNYLAQQDMELVSNNGQQLYAGNDALRALRAGSVQVRQRPGPRNVLGAVKFAMPNPMNIYLHATSAQELFSRQRRDLSHGCIRLEQPATLAEFVLRNDASWNRGAVVKAMEPGPTRTAMLGTPVPVVLLYATAVVDRQGRALFLDDIYGLDKRLDETLQRQRVRPPED